MKCGLKKNLMKNSFKTWELREVGSLSQNLLKETH